MKEFKNGEGLDRYEIAQEVVIDAPSSKVWTALTTDIGKWWAFRLVDGEVSLDAQLGGHFVEKAADGSGALWGVVTQVKAGTLLRLEGQLGMTDMPVKSHYTYELEGKGDGTLLKLTHYCFGQLSADSGKDHNEGWKALLGTHLKEHVETGKTTRIDK